MKCSEAYPQNGQSRRRSSVTEHPTAQWTAQQIVDAFPLTAPPEQGSEDIMTAPRSLWQKPYVERLF